GQIISGLSLFLALIPLYLLSSHLFDSRTAFWAGAAFVVSPQINGYADELIRGPLFILFLGWTVYFAVRALEEARKADFILVTVFALLAFLCRVEGVLLLPIFWLAICISSLRDQKKWRELTFGGL